MAKVLENTLLEVAIALGIDEDTGLTGCVSSQKPFTDTFSMLQNGLRGPYQLHVLGILAGSTAVFPLSKTKIDGSPYYSKHSTFCPSVDTGDTKKERLRRSMSYASSSVEAIPYSNEVIYSLSTLCFPDGGYISQCEREPRVIYLVLTNIEGERSYACCLIFDRKFSASLDPNNENGKNIIEACGVYEADTQQVESNGTEGDTSSHSSQEGEATVIYTPTGLCFVSKYPYFNVMRQCLSALNTKSLRTASSKCFWEEIMRLSSHVLCLPAPPPGPVSIEFTLNGHSCLIPSAEEPEQRAVDIELHWPFLFLSTQDIITVFASILTQQRIIFLSSRYPMLTLVIESFFTFIEPFKWCLTYVPVLPSSLADLIEAPGPFIMGCHSSLKKQILLVRNMEEIPAIVLVNLDEGSVEMNENDKVPPMPDTIVKTLNYKLRQLKYMYNVELIGRPEPQSYQEALVRQRKFYENFALKVKVEFLDAMVSLFGDTSGLMRFSDKYFDRKAYINLKLDDDVPFYEAVCSSYAFDRFVSDRLENPERRDIFAVAAEKIFSSQKSVLQRNRSSTNVSSMSRSPPFSISSLFTTERDEFKMPAFLNRSLATGDYFRQCVELLTQSIERGSVPFLKMKASYFYLRGMMYMACNEPIRALEDFFSLYELGEELFPKEYVSDIISCLNEVDQQRLEEQEFYRRTANFRKYLKRSEEQRARAVSRRLPKSSIGKDDFIYRVKTLQIVLSDEVAEWLYHVMTYNHSDKVEPDQFEFLYKSFFDVEKHLRSFQCPFEGTAVENRILAISPSVNTTYGVGRLVITGSTLFYIMEGTKKWVSVIRHHDIKEVVKFKYFVVFPPGVPALRIVSKDRNAESFVASLKEDRDLWARFLREMARGHEASYLYKDPSIVEIASSNVVLANVIVKMGKSPKVAEGVCAYAQTRDSEADQLSEDTRESLERRLDPSECESRRVTVMSIAYVPGRSFSESGTLWCGLGSGLIIVYETASWTSISELRFARHRIGCLLLVEDKHVWAGSWDSVIYIITVDTRTTAQRLSKHSGFISDIVRPDDDSGTVWSASYSGQLIQWDIKTGEPVREHIELEGVATLSKLIFASGKLWCITRDSVVVLSPYGNGEVLQKITTQDQNLGKATFEFGCRLAKDKIWIITDKKNQVFALNTASYKLKEEKILSKGSFSVLLAAGDSVWIGCKDGELLIVDPVTLNVLRELKAHTDVIKCMCLTREGHIVTGSSSGDGKLCVWNAEEKDLYESADSLGYEVVDGQRIRCSCK